MIIIMVIVPLFMLSLFKLRLVTPLRTNEYIPLPTTDLFIAFYDNSFPLLSWKLFLYTAAF